MYYLTLACRPQVVYRDNNTSRTRYKPHGYVYTFRASQKSIIFLYVASFHVRPASSVMHNTYGVVKQVIHSCITRVLMFCC